MKSFVVVAAAAVFLAGCNATGPRHPGENFLSDAEIRAKDDRECQSYGAAPGSQAYMICRMNLNQNRTNASVAQQQSAANLGVMGAMMLNNRY